MISKSECVGIKKHLYKIKRGHQDLIVTKKVPLKNFNWTMDLWVYRCIEKKSTNQQVCMVSIRKASKESQSFDLTWGEKQNYSLLNVVSGFKCSFIKILDITSWILRIFSPYVSFQLCKLIGGTYALSSLLKSLN